jgi:hypothetical protein
LTVSPINAALSVVDTTGVDALPAAILSGSPTVVGTKVLQKIVGGLAGSLYRIACAADANDGTGAHYVIPETLPVE